MDRPQFADILSALSESLGAMTGYLDIGAFNGESTVVDMKECSREMLELVEEQCFLKHRLKGNVKTKQLYQMNRLCKILNFQL